MDQWQPLQMWLQMFFCYFVFVCRFEIQWFTGKKCIATHAQARRKGRGKCYISKGETLEGSLLCFPLSEQRFDGRDVHPDKNGGRRKQTFASPGWPQATTVSFSWIPQHFHFLFVLKVFLKGCFNILANLMIAIIPIIMYKLRDMTLKAVHTSDRFLAQTKERKL